MLQKGKDKFWFVFLKTFLLKSFNDLERTKRSAVRTRGSHGIVSYVVMKLLEFICPAVLPIPFSLYFDFFDGFIQAYVFVFLTSLFIKEAIE